MASRSKTFTQQDLITDKNLKNQTFSRGRTMYEDKLTMICLIRRNFLSLEQALKNDFLSFCFDSNRNSQPSLPVVTGRIKNKPEGFKKFLFFFYFLVRLIGSYVHYVNVQELHTLFFIEHFSLSISAPETQKPCPHKISETVKTWNI